MKVLSLLCSSSLALAAIPRVTLNNGVTMPVVSAGTWQYNNTVAEQSCTDALAAGFDHFDTAHDYGCQAGVAKFFKVAVAQKGRENLFLTTKVPACGAQGVRAGEYCYADTAKFMQEDLDQLQVPFVDLMLIHFPPKDFATAAGCKAIQDQWKAAEELYAAKKTRAIGVSNYCPSCFECLAKTQTVVPQVNQVQYHVGMGPDPQGLKTYLDQRKIVMQAYSPLGDGTSELITGPLVTAIGKAHGKTGPQIALKWVLQTGVPLSTKSTSPEYLAQDIDLFDFTLSDAEMAQLSAATSPKGTPSFICDTK